MKDSNGFFAVKAIAAMLLILMPLVVWSGVKGGYETKLIQRSTAPTGGKMQTLGIVRYYTHKDTIFMDRRFSWVEVKYSNRRTGKMDIRGLGEGPIIHDKDRKGKWWYAVIRHSKYLNKKDFYVSAVILRGCHVKNEPKIHIAWDAYLYNITMEIGRDKTTGNPSKAINNLLDYIGGK